MYQSASKYKVVKMKHCLNRVDGRQNEQNLYSRPGGALVGLVIQAFLMM